MKSLFDQPFLAEPRAGVVSGEDSRQHRPYVRPSGQDERRSYAVQPRSTARLGVSGAELVPAGGDGEDPGGIGRRQPATEPGKGAGPRVTARHEFRDLRMSQTGDRAGDGVQNQQPYQVLHRLKSTVRELDGRTDLWTHTSNGSQCAAPRRCGLDT